MTDAFFVFPNAGFDDEVVRASVEKLQEGLAAFMESVRQLWVEIRHIFTRTFRPLIQQLRTIVRLGIIPREYRDTMMRRKIRGAVSRGFVRRR